MLYAMARKGVREYRLSFAGHASKTQEAVDRGYLPSNYTLYHHLSPSFENKLVGGYLNLKVTNFGLFFDREIVGCSLSNSLTSIYDI
jgi:hypothetical protein